MTLLAILGILAGALLLGTLLPTPVRVACRVALTFFVVLSPVLAVAVLLSTWDRATLGTWLALAPLTFLWLATIDMRYGIAARLARRPTRSRDRNGNGRESANGSPTDGPDRE